MSCASRGRTSRLRSDRTVFSGSFHSGAYSACMPRCSLANQSMPPTCRGRGDVMHVRSFLAADLAAGVAQKVRSTPISEVSSASLAQS